MGAALGLGVGAQAAAAVPVTIAATPSPANNAMPTFHGTAGSAVTDSRVTVNVYTGTGTGTTYETLSNVPVTAGSWNVAASPPLLDGTYTAQATQTQTVSGTVVSSLDTFTVDTTAPLVSLIVPASGARVGNPTPFGGAAGTADGDSPFVTVNVYAGAGTDAGSLYETLPNVPVTGGSWLTSASLPDGTYTAQATQTDAAGNLGASAANTFRVDTTRGPPAPPPPPTASFFAVPAAPAVGDLVTLVSTSSDLANPIISQAWDLRGYGTFADASGPAASVVFTTPGRHPVALRVTDAGGANAVARKTIVVAPLGQQPKPRLLSPFPVVTIAGRVTSRGAALRLLSVDAPVGSTVDVSCHGRGCPARDISRVAAARRGAGSVRRVSFTRFERPLRAGVVLRIRVTKLGLIGKYTSFFIRRGKVPRRIDKCISPGASLPSSCPAS